MYCRLKKFLLFAATAVGLMVLDGCVSVPTERVSEGIETQELADHVSFLAGDAMKGRKPGTRESEAVRRYIKGKFEACGLTAWKGCKNYEQSFGFGKNVIGVLAGTDPELADEIVMLSAHYDHLGKRKKDVYYGACDNASGVAALLEIAEYLSDSANRPRRSVCFAAFDCEEMYLLGSFAFACSRNFEGSKVVAAVNIDLLGRDFLDVAKDSLFVIGTEGYPVLRERIDRESEQAGIKAWPVGTDVVGPRGDHFAFETLNMPVLFFTCGMYPDYHKPTDTAEKLNAGAMRSSTVLICETVKELANAEVIEPRAEQTAGDKEELQTLMYLVDVISAEKAKFKLTDEQIKKLKGLSTEMGQLADSETYTSRQRKQFLNKAIKVLFPVMAALDESFKKAEGLLQFYSFYYEHRDVLNVEMRDFMCHIIQNRPGLLDAKKFEIQTYTAAFQ